MNGSRPCLPERGGTREELIAPGTPPVLIHCAAGKDRTGVMVAVLLAALGVPDRTIAEDYARSIVCLGPDYIAETRKWVEERRLDWAWERTADTPPERMLKTLAYLKRWFGSVHQYLIDHGLAADRINELRALLTEPAQSVAS